MDQPSTRRSVLRGGGHQPRRLRHVLGGNGEKARTALRTGAERLNPPTRHDLVATITAQNHDIGTAWRLKEQLRDLFRIAHPPARSPPRRLRRWIQRARDSGIRPPFEHLARRLEQHFDGIINTIKLGITNGSSRASTPRSASSTPAATAITPPNH